MSRRSTMLSILLVFVLALAMTACGGNDDAASDNGSGMAMGGDHESFDFGEPADAADADRTVEVTAADTLTYDPASLDVEEGETIRFVVTNGGQAVHEFTLGDADLQAEHEQEMQDMMENGQMTMDDEPNALSIEPGDTEELVWHFTKAGSYEFACHQPGHYAGGMKGAITVS